jgi:hypothetical protein
LLIYVVEADVMAADCDINIEARTVN